MSISTTYQSVTVDEATTLIVTGIEQGADGFYAREVRVSAPINANGDTDIIFRLKIRSATREGVEIATPSLTL